MLHEKPDDRDWTDEEIDAQIHAIDAFSQHLHDIGFVGISVGAIRTNKTYSIDVMVATKRIAKNLPKEWKGIPITSHVVGKIRPAEKTS